MSSYNHITLVGVLSNDPVFEEDTARFTISVERYNGRTKAPSMDHFKIVATGTLGRVACQYVSKGKKILVDGTIRVYREDDGDKSTWTTDIMAENIKWLSQDKAA